VAQDSRDRAVEVQEMVDVATPAGVVKWHLDRSS
jgi:hypothetical protein